MVENVIQDEWLKNPNTGKYEQKGFEKRKIMILEHDSTWFKGIQEGVHSSTSLPAGINKVMVQMIEVQTETGDCEIINQKGGF